MGAVLDDLYDHEGFGARRLPDGTLTATWTATTADFDAYVAACGCGWRGDEDRPPTDDGYESALADWEHAHARPLLAGKVPDRVAELIRDLRTEVGALVKERPAAAQEALRDVRAWADATVALVRGAAPPPNRAGRPLRGLRLVRCAARGTRRNHSASRHDEVPPSARSDRSLVA
ncbi:MAG: hypothetical protein ACRD2W_21605 [Acidimicrobiales bacterium]